MAHGELRNASEPIAYSDKDNSSMDGHADTPT